MDGCEMIAVYVDVCVVWMCCMDGCERTRRDDALRPCVVCSLDSQSILQSLLRQEEGGGGLASHNMKGALSFTHAESEKLREQCTTRS